MRKVLVTGAGGFIGSHLAADQARRGHQVIAMDVHLDRVAHLQAPGWFDLIEGDVCDEQLQHQALQGVDTVFHLAAAHLSVRSGEAEFWRVNVDAVRNLIEACRKAGIRRFVHCSSVGVYGRLLNPPANEESPCFPEIPYEITKLEGEKVVLDAIQATGFPAVILRPVWVYGPGCPRTEKLFHSIAKGRFFLAGQADALRHCVYIRDMVEAFHLASVSDVALGQKMIVGDAAPIPVRELITRMAEVAGAKVPRTLPLWALYFSGVLAEILFKPLGKDPPLSRRTLKFFTNNTAFEIGRARRLLGYEPKYDLSAGLSETYALLASGKPMLLPMPEPTVKPS